MSLLQMNFSGSVFIILILLIRFFAINKLPKNTFLILWGLVIFRLLVPFSIPSPFSVYTVFNTNDAIQGTVSQSPIAHLLPISAETGNFHIESMIQHGTGSFSVVQIIYFTGAIVVALFFATAYVYWLKKLHHACPITNPYIVTWMIQHPRKRKIRFCQCAAISSPLTYGIFSPVIVLPEAITWDNKTEIDYVLLHEYQHIQRFDCILKVMAVIAVCIHWFNPMIWLMYFFLNRDMELSCDEFVVKNSDKTTRATYARLLIALEEKRNNPLMVCNEFSLNISEERITAIMKTKHFTVFHITAATILITVLCAGFMTSARSIIVNAELPNTKEMFALHTNDLSETQQVFDPSFQWVWPATNKEVSLPFGYQSRMTGKKSDHICIKGQKDDAVFAATSGQVIDIGYNKEYGNYLVMESEGNIKTVYGHMDHISLSVMDTVETGERVGMIGRSGTATGYCLSFAVFVNNQAVDPMMYYE